MAINIKSALRAVWAQIVFIVGHPTVVKKELVAAATSVTTDIAAFNTVLPYTPPKVQAAVATVQAFAVLILSLLSSNESKLAAIARKGR